MSDISESSCPKCGESLPPGAPNGLCPVCLMAGAMEPTCDGESNDRQVLDIEVVQEAFSQLEILEVIGVGGMGVVYKAKQTSLGRDVALKLLAPNRVQEAGFSERFEREARALAAMDHPNIVTVHDFGREGDFYYLLMEYVDGVNLRQALKASRFTPEQALTIVPVVCDALQYAHDLGVVHRDIKPENLLLDKSGKIKIADFGIARILNLSDSDITVEEGGESIDAAQLTKGSALGTPSYMAPEQVSAPEDVDHRADIYSLGVVFYEMLTGERPAAKIAPLVRKVELDVRLDEIVLRALSDSPELRFQSATELRTQVEAFSTVQDRPVSAAQTTFDSSSSTPVEPLESKGRIWKWLSVALGVVSVPFVLGGMFLTGTVLSMEFEGGAWNPARNELLFSIVIWAVACLLPAVTAVCLYRWMSANADTSNYLKVLRLCGVGLVGAAAAVAVLFFVIDWNEKRSVDVLQQELAKQLDEENDERRQELDEEKLIGALLPEVSPGFGNKSGLDAIKEKRSKLIDRIPKPNLPTSFAKQFPAPGPADPPLKNTHDLVDTYLRAADWRSRIPYIYRGESLVSEIKAYYKQRPDFSVDRFKMKLFQLEKDEQYGGPFWVYQINLTDDEKGGYPLVIRVENGNLKVDWEVYTEFSDQHFVRIMGEKDFSPTQFRLVAERISSYPGADRDAFEDLDKFDCYELNPPYGGYREFYEHAFVAKDSALAKELDSKIGFGDDPLAVIIEVDRKDFSHGIKHYVITDFIDEGWF